MADLTGDDFEKLRSVLTKTKTRGPVALGNETGADGAKDQPAADFIVGRVPNTMVSAYP